MLFQKLAIFSALAAFAAAQDINQDDIPQQCTAVCAEVVSISRRCDDTTNDDRAELDCVCRTPNANVLIPTCEACVAQFDTDTDNDDTTPDQNDVLEVLTRCNFTTTTYNTASANSILSSVASSFASASGTVAVITSGTVVRTTSIAAQTSAPPQQSVAAAPMQTAAMGLGALGLAMHLL
ncbi:hypothetical protein FB567DRAFT_350312 [Paraphoma chrysanthemicola]|uniref:Extracellular membrane protein CFEM domain-containing protein n=1 Tax=Paraphoma chrysanthemicola TaxID=798071 RepID=A0A8K0R5Y2_9PLEO|nr:hypothetical protein FB567DRAFT_350312 [Paraphoma chrysanthemicola]